MKFIEYTQLEEAYRKTEHDDAHNMYMSLDKNHPWRKAYENAEPNEQRKLRNHLVYVQRGHNAIAAGGPQDHIMGRIQARQSKAAKHITRLSKMTENIHEDEYQGVKGHSAYTSVFGKKAQPKKDEEEFADKSGKGLQDIMSPKAPKISGKSRVHVMQDDGEDDKPSLAQFMRSKEKEHGQATPAQRREWSASYREMYGESVEVVTTKVGNIFEYQLCVNEEVVDEGIAPTENGALALAKRKLETQSFVHEGNIGSKVLNIAKTIGKKSMSALDKSAEKVCEPIGAGVEKVGSTIGKGIKTILNPVAAANKRLDK